MAVNKIIILSGVAAGIVVVASAAGGAIFAANMSSNSLPSITPIEKASRTDLRQRYEVLIKCTI